MKNSTSYVILLLMVHLSVSAWGHARLMEPPSRSSMWRVGFPTKKNFNDNALYCGGLQVQWHRNGGKCGICGDPWHMPHPRENEAGGAYGRGIIVRSYKSGQVMTVTIDVTTNHKGYFEFRLCPNNNPRKEATQECLDNHLLLRADGQGPRYSVADGRGGLVSVPLQLPPGVTCTQCVLQWTWIAGNNWGPCKDGQSRTGCGPQETFRGCSDIAIGHSITGGKDGNSFAWHPDSNEIGVRPRNHDKPQPNHPNPGSHPRETPEFNNSPHLPPPLPPLQHSSLPPSHPKWHSTPPTSTFFRFHGYSHSPRIWSKSHPDENEVVLKPLFPKHDHRSYHQLWSRPGHLNERPLPILPRAYSHSDLTLRPTNSWLGPRYWPQLPTFAPAPSHRTMGPFEPVSVRYQTWGNTES